MNQYKEMCNNKMYEFQIGFGNYWLAKAYIPSQPGEMLFCLDCIYQATLSVSSAIITTAY